MRKLIGIIGLLVTLLQAQAAGGTNITPQDFQLQLANFLSNPNIAYVLFLLAIYGIFFEIAHPGLILPGLTGILALILVIYAFQLLPFNYIGIALIVFGVLLMIAEIYLSSFGVIGLGGIIAFIAGSFLLFNTPNHAYHLSFGLIFLMSAISGVFIFIIANLAIKSHKRKVVSGKEGLIGCEGNVKNISDGEITVQVLGETWDAVSTETLKAGDKIKVIGVKGLTLLVELNKNKGES